jgi:hypothetical protein
MMSRSKAALLTATTVSLGLVGTAAADNPYVAGDMHNHNTCTDGSVAVGYAIDRSVGTGAASAGGENFNLDWFTLGNHGGSGNRDCRFADTSAKLPGETTQYWVNNFGKTIQGITVNSLLGTPNNGNMWRWQNIQQVEYPILANRGGLYADKVLVEGLEWIVPGHEHTDVAILAGQATRKGAGNADAMAEFEFRFDRADTDAIGPLDSSSKQVWPGKDNVNNNGTAGHGKAVAAIQWLQANYPLQSYAIPTHSERHGPFDPASSNGGYNIEHFRDFNNAGPTVAFGIEAPGHFAQGSVAGGSGSYEPNAVGGGTYGMSGVYTAKVGGLWDGLLGEGRNFFMFVSSDWHNRGVFGARDAATTSDFIPGEYTKIYVPNADHFRPQSIVEGMRTGRSYSVNGDIIGPDLVFRARASHGHWQTMGQTLVVEPGERITVEMALSVPASNNSPYSFSNPLLAQVGISQPLNKPSLDHVDLITGKITGVIQPGAPGYAVPNAGGVAGAAIVYNPSAKIAQQIGAWEMHSRQQQDGSIRYRFTTTLRAGRAPMYLRARGTNIPVGTPNVTDSEGNPLIDSRNAQVSCTDPACPAHLGVVAGVKKVTYDVQAYSNLWFYANPIFVRPEGTPKLLVERNAELARELGHHDDDDSRD